MAKGSGLAGSMPLNNLDTVLQSFGDRVRARHNQVRRVAKLFALVVVAGENVTRFGILP